MASKCFFRKYFICFFLFGINSRNPFNLPKRIHNRTCSIIPRVLHSIFLCTFLYLMCQNVFNDLKNSFKVLSLKYLMVSTNSFPNMVSLFSTLIKTDGVEEIMLMLNRAGVHLSMIANISVELRALERSLRIKCVFGVVISSLMYFLKIMVRSAVFSCSLDLFSFILVTYKCWTIFVVIFFIDYTGFLMFSMNQGLTSAQCEISHLDARSSNSIHLLQQIRIVHYQLYAITSMINSQFGWFLIATLLDMFNVVTSSVFVVFLVTDDSTAGIWILRNFLLNTN